MFVSLDIWTAFLSSTCSAELMPSTVVVASTIDKFLPLPGFGSSSCFDVRLVKYHCSGSAAVLESAEPAGARISRLYPPA